jgi:Txe/YoeB family toxin of Txe-Axe toxin-antitoxin module
MSHKYLRRYTDISALVYLLSEKKITLLDPKSWDDSNDSHYLSVYKNKRHLQTILALCFSQASETYHHWRVFAGSSAGVCIRFKRTDLIKTVNAHPGVIVGEVEYLKLREIRVKTLHMSQLPFVKRFAFEDEDEYRIIFESETENLSKLDVPIELACIDQVTLSPWMHKDLSFPIIKLLKSIEGCSKISFVRSTLVNNEEWKNISKSAA